MREPSLGRQPGKSTRQTGAGTAVDPGVWSAQALVEQVEQDGVVVRGVGGTVAEQIGDI